MDVKEEVKALWKCCFSDGDDFVDLYFSMRFKEEINRVVVKDGRVVSALQAIPYPMTFYAREINTAYISGACTHPDFRGHGVMKQLLKEAHRRMYEEGIFLSTLIPAESWLREYYAKSGYGACFYYGRTAVELSGLEALDSKCEVEVCENAEAETYDYFNAKMRQRPNCIQHTLEDYRVILADMRLGGGLVMVARQEGEITGLAFCVEENAVPVIQEMLYTTPIAKDMLCRKVLSAYGTEHLEYIHPIKDSSPIFLGMARIISVKGMLSLYAETHPGESFSCHLDGDEAIPENNGYYAIENGECTVGRLSEREYKEYTLESLVQKLFQAEQPYMSLMLN